MLILIDEVMMNKSIKLLLVSTISMTTLLGCAQQYQNQYQYQPTSAEIRSRDLNFTSRRVNSDTKECFEKIQTNDVVKYVSQNILYTESAKLNKLTLMSSNKKLTDSQIKSLLDYFAVVQECREITLNGWSQYTQYQTLYKNYFSDLDILYAKLVAKEATIGQTNREKSERFSKFNSEWASLNANTGSQFERQHNEEQRGREADLNARRAMAAQYLNQQRQYQIQPIAPIFNVPQPQNPTNTNCSPDGFGGFRCTTR
jgi:hypothetical protein